MHEVDFGARRCVVFVIADRAAKPNAAQLTGHLREPLAGYKVPARIFLVDAFPVMESANWIKIQRGRLRDMAMEDRGG